MWKMDSLKLKQVDSEQEDKETRDLGLKEKNLWHNAHKVNSY